MTGHETPVSVLIADSQFLITESLKVVLNSDGQYNVAGIVTGKSELIKVLQSENISVLILDNSTINFIGVYELKEIKSSFPDLKMLIITNGVSRAELHELNSAGINNIMLKTAGREELFEALRATIKGKKYYSDGLLDLIFEVNKRKKTVEESIHLTNSEMEIVRLIADGLTTKEIASKKFISFHTVISHRKNIFRKLGVSSISELIMAAIKAGWINTIEYNI